MLQRNDKISWDQTKNYNPQMQSGNAFEVSTCNLYNMLCTINFVRTTYFFMAKLIKLRILNVKDIIFIKIFENYFPIYISSFINFE